MVAWEVPRDTSFPKVTMVDLATKSLFYDKTRFAITVAGVAFAVTLVFVQVGLFGGILENASVTIEHTDADLWITSKNTPNVDFPHAFPASRVDRVRGVPGVLRADNLIVTYLQVAQPSGAEETAIVYGLDDFSTWNLPWAMPEGDARDLRRGDFIALDDSATRRFGAFTVGDRREVAGRRLQIVGRTHGAKSFTTTPIAFASFDLAQSLQRTLEGNTTYVLVKLQPGADISAVKREIAARMPYNDVFTSAEWAKRSRDYWVSSTGIGINMYMTVFLGCLVGIVVVAQTLYTQTMEHLREFGTVKAIGGSNGDIYRVLLKQAGISAVVGFLLGLIPAYALRPVVAKADLSLAISPTFIAEVFVGTLLLCALASLVSFRKVASIDPALVFRT